MAERLAIAGILQKAVYTFEKRQRPDKQLRTVDTPWFHVIRRSSRPRAQAEFLLQRQLLDRILGAFRIHSAAGRMKTNTMVVEPSLGRHSVNRSDWLSVGPLKKESPPVRIEC